VASPECGHLDKEEIGKEADGELVSSLDTRIRRRLEG
jgi:hypothetical protein